MSKADVLTLSNELALGLADPVQLGTYYADLVRLLGNEPVLTNAQAQDIDALVRDYATPDEAVLLLAVYVGDRELPHTLERELEAIDSDWRNAVPGIPRVYTDEDLSENAVALYPTPADDALGTDQVFDDDFGLDFVPGQLSFIYTEERDDVLPWLELWLAVAILEREFERESNHRDLPFAGSAGQLAQVIKKMIS